MMFRSLLSVFRQQAKMQAEIIALRHQLTVLQRTPYPKRLLLNRTDRWFWVWLSRLWSAWRSALIIVKPETVVGWHRRGFQSYWTYQDYRSLSSEIYGPASKTSVPNLENVSA